MATSNSMVGHKWAHGNAAKGSNFYTDGSSLTSYGTTVGYNTGRGLVFLSLSNMSSSTGKQLCHAQRAASHLDVVCTPYFSYGHKVYTFSADEAFKAACESVDDELQRLNAARLTKHLSAHIERVTNQAAALNVIAAKYGLPIYTFTEIDATKSAAAKEYAASYAAKELERREAARVREHARLESQRTLDAAQFNRWRAGEPVACPASYTYDEHGGYYITIRGDKVITSGGASCPLIDAQRGVEFWASRELKALHFSSCGFNQDYTQSCTCGAGPHRFEPWKRNGQRVTLGDFQLDRIDADGTAYAGCHKFSTQELRRLFEVLHV